VAHVLQFFPLQRSIGSQARRGGTQKANEMHDKTNEHEVQGDMPAQGIKVWDVPTRLFHWSLAVSVTLLVVTGKTGGGAMEWHERLGYITLGLLLFRVIWGFIGSQHARFASFLRGPGEVKRYLQDLIKGRTTPSVGHNALGGWSVLSMLALIAVQVGTGLFAHDGIMLSGPLAHMVSEALSNTLTTVHRTISNIILIAIGLHLCAIAFYVFVKKDNLVMPMISGYKRLSAAPTHSIRVAVLRYGVVLMAIFSSAIFLLLGI
jgi:cytochrome b